MKFQKAKSVLHQHRVATEQLNEAGVKHEEARARFNEVNAVPEQLARTKLAHEEQLNTLTDRVKALREEYERKLAVLEVEKTEALEKVREVAAALRAPVPGLARAQAELAYAERAHKTAEGKVRQWAPYLEEAQRVVNEIEAREAAKAKEPAPHAKDVEAAKTQKKVAEGKLIPNKKVRYDPMGNQDPSLRQLGMTPNKE